MSARPISPRIRRQKVSRLANKVAGLADTIWLLHTLALTPQTKRRITLNQHALERTVKDLGSVLDRPLTKEEK